MKLDIIPFWRVTEKYGEFSNWYIHPDAFDDDVRDMMLYTSVEQQMMFSKAAIFQDTETAQKIINEHDPKKLKALGREVKGYNDKVWSRVRYGYVFEACIDKFVFYNDLCDLLLGTGDALLVEASPFDKVWGVGLGPDHPDITNPSLWQGENLLGQVLMDVRTCLRNE
jgi:ribA/ribD-fused uncharacterized protein